MIKVLKLAAIDTPASNVLEVAPKEWLERRKLNRGCPMTQPMLDENEPSMLQRNVVSESVADILMGHT